MMFREDRKENKGKNTVRKEEKKEINESERKKGRLQFYIIILQSFVKWMESLRVGKNSASVQFSRLVVSDSLRPHESQHARLPCPSPSPGVHWDLHPLSQWCHPAISSSVVPFSSCPQSLPASESFPMSQLFACLLLMHVQFLCHQICPVLSFIGSGSHASLRKAFYITGLFLHIFPFNPTLPSLMTELC